MIKKIEPTEEVCLKFTDEEVKELGIEVGTKFTVKQMDNGFIQLIPFSKIEIDLNELPREILEQLIIESCDKDKSINDVVSDILKAIIKENSEGVNAQEA